MHCMLQLGKYLMEVDLNTIIGSVNGALNSPISITNVVEDM